MVVATADPFRFMVVATADPSRRMVAATAVTVATMQGLVAHDYLTTCNSPMALPTKNVESLTNADVIH